MRSSFAVLLALVNFVATAQGISPRQGSEARSYQEVIESYQYLAQQYPNAQLLELGPSDSGRPLHLFLMQKSPFTGEASLQSLAQDKLRILINNGIHPGESCGMDAAVEWSAEQLAQGTIAAGQIWAMIPVYNIGGSLKARPHTRANQNGPDLQGFRGNAQNLDLNRDFVKADALNTRSFYAIYQAFKPQIFIDTHTSNGADYPYTMTLISSLADKLAPSVAQLLHEDMEPFLYQAMAEREWEMIPYVNVFGRTPNQGYAAFLESPRYASGYTALFHSFGFITEAHMFKPYPDRVAATRAFFASMQEYCNAQAEAIKQAYQQALTWEKEQSSFPVAWSLDSSRTESLDFKAYPYEYVESELGDYQALRYKREDPESLQIDYYPHYKTEVGAQIPEYYLIPQAFSAVVQRLQYNNVEVISLKEDSLIDCKSYYLRQWQFGNRPYEGHFRVEVDSVEPMDQKRLFYAGDYLVPTDQQARYYLASVLDPRSVDSFLSWGFFDIIFQQKEYFSPYVFEAKAQEMLDADPSLAQEFEQWKSKHPEALKNAYTTLSFFYQRSEYYEPEHLRYPVGFVD